MKAGEIYTAGLFNISILQASNYIGSSDNRVMTMQRNHSSTDIYTYMYVGLQCKPNLICYSIIHIGIYGFSSYEV
jgi:hypothetical protein